MNRRRQRHTDISGRLNYMEKDRQAKRVKRANIYLSGDMETNISNVISG